MQIVKWTYICSKFYTGLRYIISLISDSISEMHREYCGKTITLSDFKIASQASQAQMYVKEQSDEVDERALILTQGVLDDIS